MIFKKKYKSKYKTYFDKAKKENKLILRKLNNYKYYTKTEKGFLIRKCDKHHKIIFQKTVPDEKLAKEIVEYMKSKDWVKNSETINRVHKMIDDYRVEHNYKNTGWV